MWRNLPSNWRREIWDCSLLRASGAGSSSFGELYGSYHKSSHFEALISAEKLLNLAESRPEILIRCFKADILAERPKIGSFEADMIIADVPYGQLTAWHTSGEADWENRLPANLRKAVSANGVIAIISHKKPKLASEFFDRIERFNAGSRKISIFSPV